MSAEELSPTDIMRCLLENYRLFETYFRDRGVEEVTYRGKTYNFQDILRGSETLSSDEYFSIKWVYIDQNPTTKKALKENGLADYDILGHAERGVEKLAAFQAEDFGEDK